MDLAPCARSRTFGEPADAIPRFGERHPAMHRATFTTTVHDWEHRCFVFAFYWLPVRGTTLPLFFAVLPPSFFLFRKAFRHRLKTSEEKLRRFSPFYVYIFFEDIDRFLQTGKIRSQKLIKQVAYILAMYRQFLA